jgi:hypothetical protein
LEVLLLLIYIFFYVLILVFNKKINFYLIRNLELVSKKKLEPFTTKQSHVHVQGGNLHLESSPRGCFFHGLQIYSKEYDFRNFSFLCLFQVFINYT